MRLSHRAKIASKRIGIADWLKKYCGKKSCASDSAIRTCTHADYAKIFSEVKYEACWKEIILPAPPTAPLPPKHERYISNGCVIDVLNISEPAKKTVTQKLAGFITSLTNRVRGVFNA